MRPVILTLLASNSALLATSFSPIAPGSAVYRAVSSSSTVTAMSSRIALCRRRSTASHNILAASSSDKEEEGEQDLFEFFDPTLSPHAYPDGIPKSPHQQMGEDEEEEEDWSPFHLSTVKNDFHGGSNNDYLDQPRWSQPTSTSRRSQRLETDKEEDVLELFDPRISPHEYPNGIPTTTSTTTPKGGEKTGIVLIDHGSKKASSNEQLEALASLYQSKLDPNKFIVRAAHMEIASPSIYDAISNLVQNEPRVTKIICHPYFLSMGRHVTDDIPHLIQQAVDQIPKCPKVVTTRPIGSDLNIMVKVLDDIVLEALNQFSSHPNTNKSSSSMGGLFGEIQRMIEQEE